MLSVHLMRMVYSSPIPYMNKCTAQLPASVECTKSSSEETVKWTESSRYHDGGSTVETIKPTTASGNFTARKGKVDMSQKGGSLLTPLSRPHAAASLSLRNTSITTRPSQSQHIVHGGQTDRQTLVPRRG